MKSQILNVVGSQVLSKKSQQEIKGGISGKPDLSLCGCDCAGNVTGPFYCSFYIGCTQQYDC